MKRSLPATLDVTHTPLASSVNENTWSVQVGVETDASAWELFEEEALARVERVIAEVSVTLSTR